MIRIELVPAKPDALRLADYVRSLPDFQVYTTMDGAYDHVGATVADAILQANRKYAVFVKPRVNRILREYPSARTTSAVLALLQNTETTAFLGVRDATRAARVEQVLAVFASEAVETETDLRDWLLQRDGGARLRTITGIGPKTADYFKILVGIPESAIDRHLFGFLRVAGVDSGNYEAAQATINAAADLLGVNWALFDHSIWQYMSQRAQAARITTGQARRHNPACAGGV